MPGKFLDLAYIIKIAVVQHRLTEALLSRLGPQITFVVTTDDKDAFLSGRGLSHGSEAKPKAGKTKSLLTSVVLRIPSLSS